MILTKPIGFLGVLFEFHDIVGVVFELHNIVGVVWYLLSLWVFWVLCLIYTLWVLCDTFYVPHIPVLASVYTVNFDDI